MRFGLLLYASTKRGMNCDSPVAKLIAEKELFNKKIPYKRSRHRFISVSNVMAKTFYGLRFKPDLYSNFRKIAAANGYTATGAFEQFMQLCVETDTLAFAQKTTPSLETEARVLMDWLKKGKFFCRSERGEEISIQGKLLWLLPKVADPAIKKQIEDTLKNSVPKQN